MKILLGFEEASSASNTGVVYWNMAQGDIPSEWSGDILSITAPGILCNYTEADAIAMIRRWAGMMAPGGELIVTVPDAKEIGKAIAEGVGGVDYTKTLYGNGERKSLWDARGLALALKSNWFPYTERLKGETPYTLIVRGRTATDSTVLDEDGRCKIAGVMGVMSCPRLGFISNQRTMNDISYHCGIPFSLQETVFWGQGLTRGIEDAIEQGARYILTMDYDTVCDPRHVFDLVRIMDTTGVDALAAGQMRRGITALLAYMDEDNARRFMQGDEIAKAKTAHFGLTLLRAEAFKKMPRPWFIAKPDADGRWSDGKVDEDIVFWQQWAECGNTLAVTPQVCIGHAEVVVSCVGYDGRKVHVPTNEMATAHTKARY